MLVSYKAFKALKNILTKYISDESCILYLPYSTQLAEMSTHKNWCVA